MTTDREKIQDQELARLRAELARRTAPAPACVPHPAAMVAGFLGLIYLFRGARG